MRVIDLDATNWKAVMDYCDALRAALGSPKGHGTSPDAFLDSMIWGGMNKMEPPYTIRILNTKALPKDILKEMESLCQYLPISRAEFRTEHGYDIDVNLEIIP